MPSFIRMSLFAAVIKQCVRYISREYFPHNANIFALLNAFTFSNKLTVKIVMIPAVIVPMIGKDNKLTSKTTAHIADMSVPIKVTANEVFDNKTV